MWDCPLMVIRPLSAIGIRTFRTATYRHVGDATSRAQNASDSDRSRGRCAHGHTRCSGSRTVEIAARHPVRFATASVGDLTRTDTVSARTAPRRAPYRRRPGEQPTSQTLEIHHAERSPRRRICWPRVGTFCWPPTQGLAPGQTLLANPNEVESVKSIFQGNAPGRVATVVPALMLQGMNDTTIPAETIKNPRRPDVCPRPSRRTDDLRRPGPCDHPTLSP